MANPTNSKEDVNVKKLYGKECTLSKEDFIQNYNIKINGLSSDEANENLNKYGLNEIKQNKPKKWYNYLFESLFSPFNTILLRYCACSILY